MSFSALELPRKVKFKDRKKTKSDYVPKGIKEHRSYKDFEEYIKLHPDAKILEMDTVIGRIGGKVIMTWIFCPQNFMIGFLIENKTALEVTNAFNNIKSIFKANNHKFCEYVPVILTDNGCEFSNVFAIEQDNNGDKELSVFFCDPMCSWQKPHVEKNHTLLRDICPKGTSFDTFTQTTVNMIFSHINSVARKEFNGKSAYEMFEFTYGKKITSLLGINKIPPKEVIQSPVLLKK